MCVWALGLGDGAVWFVRFVCFALGIVTPQGRRPVLHGAPSPLLGGDRARPRFAGNAPTFAAPTFAAPTFAARLPGSLLPRSLTWCTGTVDGVGCDWRDWS